MPFLEILAPPIPDARRREVAAAATDGICRAFSVGPETVTLYFLDIPASLYAHAGEAGGPVKEQRIFIKVHAYRRGPAERRAAAAALTAPLAALYGAAPDALAVYFLDREKDEVAHGGQLSSDAEPA